LSRQFLFVLIDHFKTSAARKLAHALWLGTRWLANEVKHRFNMINDSSHRLAEPCYQFAEKVGINIHQAWFAVFQGRDA